MQIITKKLVHLPVRKANSKKGDNGRLLVIGGSPEYVGAPALVGLAAMRSGVDSVIVAAPKKVAWAINTLSEDLMTRKLSGNFLQAKNFNVIKNLLTTADCVVMGNGVVPRKESVALMKKIANHYRGLKILDAAAIAAFDPKNLQNAILTPNPHEYHQLMQYCNVSQLIKRGNIIVQKSHRTQIFAKYQTYQNNTGNAGLTKAGTGDVLAGLIAGFAAQSKNLLQSSINGVYFLGKIGELLYKKHQGYSYLASDVAEEIRRLTKIDKN